MPEQEFVDPNELIQSKVTMHQDFIMVWDDVVEERFCNWLIEYLEQTEYLAPRRQNYLSDKQVEMHNFSPGEADYLSSLVGQCALNHIDNYPYLRSFPYMSSCVMLQKTGPREGQHHEVTFDKQDMLMYESLCVHARSTPFIGEYYRNMYFHWCPVDWDPTPYDNNTLRYKSIQEALDEV